mgnify:CR=1 FL=1
MRLLSLLALLLILPAAPSLSQGAKDAPAAAAPLAPLTARSLASHRGIYSLTLDRARENSGIVEASGAMLYELSDVCESWTTRQRFSLTLRNREGTELETSSDYATLLPNNHTIAALNAARAGQRLLVAPLFDGTSADGAQESTTVLTPWQGPTPMPELPSLATLGSSRMRIAFFEPDADQAGGARTPSYEVSLRYFENGVSDELIMDFGDFTVRGKLMKLEDAPGGC